MKPREGRKKTVVRCQYCGKNLWPLRGLFDEDFCSKDHRQRYHERVRKALEHLPKAQANPRPKGIAGFQFEKPRVQETTLTMRRSGEPRVKPSAPAVPDFTHATGRPALASSSFAIATPAPAAASQHTAQAVAIAIPPKVMSIESLRERFHRSQSMVAVTMTEAPAGVDPQPGNMAFQASQRANASHEAFDELNHVYLHEPDPVLETRFPLGTSLIAHLAPVSISSKARHIAAAGPSGAGRVEFFPMQPLTANALSTAAAKDTLPELDFHAGENIWLEDFMSWRIPVSVAATRSSVAKVPVMDRAASLERFRNASPASVSSAAPLTWRLEAKQQLERNPFESTRLAVAPAVLIEFPAVREVAVAPLSDETAIFDASTFELRLPVLPQIAGDFEMLAEIADVEPAQMDAFGPQTKIGETLLPRGSGWLPIETESVLPTNNTEMRGALAEPKIGADLIARGVPSQPRNGATSVNAGMPISLPNRAVRLKQGPEFFAAEPVVADSVTRPVAARALVETAPLAMPEVQSRSSETLLQAASSDAVLPAVTNEVAVTHAAEAIETTTMEMPEIAPPVAGFATGDLKSLDIRLFDTTDRRPYQVGWMEPQLTLNLPESHYEDYPLALSVSVPEPRTVTVFETASYDAQSKVTSIADAKPKRFGVPSYMKGMAAGLMIASFLWFGSSSIKSDGITLRPGDLLRLTIQRRAVYEVGDNFHAGLASWDGKNLGKTWAYDKEGFIRPGRLALYKPSRDMSDYKMEFLAQIERKGVNWVFRAADEQNYYAMKLAVTEPGPRPLVALIRYQVIDGKKESRGEAPLQVMMHNNRPYRVSVDVKGNHFLTSIEGQVVDSWSDDRLKTGGVGFFAEGSEKARVYWMKVTKNSDFLGKLCSILVPKES
jgi:hypothetical protein